jgi:predicted DNA-binding transcriptional regulator YafY
MPRNLPAPGRKVEDSLEVVGNKKKLEDFIREQYGKAQRRKPVRAKAPSKMRGTLFAKRNKNLAMREAALRRAQIIVTYTKTTTGETSRYVVAPYEFSFKRLKVGRRKILWGYDMNEGHIKNFATKNISKVVITDRKFTPKWPIKIT